MQIFDIDSKAVLDRPLQAHEKQYWGFYSSLWGGFSNDPRLMLLPVDDHMVHRGDGVFEALKVTAGQIYLLEAHLNRLLRSAQMIELKHSWTLETLTEIVHKTWQRIASSRGENCTEAIIRIFLSRGPGSFGTNPNDSIGAQLFVIVMNPTKPNSGWIKEGVKTAQSQIPIKPGWFSQVKSCNYLPNVLMKMEALRLGLDFTLNFDEQGYLAEGSTENVAWVSSDGVLSHPPLDHILKGTTLCRVFDLAEALGKFRLNRQARIRKEEVKKCRALMMIGTTLDVLPVQSFEDKKWTDFSIAQVLRDLLLKDQGFNV